MRGFRCDRCGTFDPGRESQREGPYLSEGWTLVSGLGMGFHLCPHCKDVVAGFARKGDVTDGPG